MDSISEFFSSILDFKLNKEQLKTVDHINGPALVLAVPGSGKTTILICRTLNLIHNYGVNPKRILSLTFSKAAALDMNNRYKLLFHDKFPYKIGFSTIHRFCYSVLLEYFRQKNLNYILLESKDSSITKRFLLKEIYENINQSILTDDAFDDISSNISLVKNMMIKPENINNKEIKIDNFNLIYLEYEKYKKNKKLMDFDDMLTMCYTLLTAKPLILEYYQNKFDYIQVDESQDTSLVQHEIIKLLTKKHNNLYMVADDDQSIYGFRGAYPDIVINFANHYKNSITYYLSTNFRSSKSIVKLCSNVISENKNRNKKSFKAFNSTLESKLNMVYTDTTNDQVNYILESYNSNTNEKSQAVLFRNNLSMIPLIDIFNRNDVDFYIKDYKQSFFNSYCTKDIISFLKFALIPNDLDSFERICYKMKAYISKKHIAFLKSVVSEENILDSLIHLPSLEAFQKKTMRKTKSNFNELRLLSPEMAISFIEDSLNYKEYLKDNCKEKGISFENQNKCLDILKFIASQTDSIVEFLTRLNELKKILYNSTQNINADSLKLFTIHGSKGLEFDEVFIIDVDENVFPSKVAVDNAEDNDSNLLEEERRLFYVALSRAKSNITVLHTKFRNGQYNKASIFIKTFIDGAGKNLTISSFNSKTEPSYLDGYNIGDKLLHTNFGVGYLIDISGDTIMIEFTEDTKTLSASLCIKNKILIKI